MDTNSNSKTTKNTIDEKTKKLFQKWFWGLFGGILCLIAIIFFLISVGLVGYVPPLEERKGATTGVCTDAAAICLTIAKRLGLLAMSTLRLSVKTRYSPSFSCKLESNAGRTKRP